MTKEKQSSENQDDVHKIEHKIKRSMSSIKKLENELEPNTTDTYSKLIFERAKKDRKFLDTTGVVRPKPITPKYDALIAHDPIRQRPCGTS